MLAAALVIGVVSTGCGKDNGREPGETPKWDPCTAFPDAALSEVGLMPERKSAVQFPGETCGWVGHEYTLNVRYTSGEQAAGWQRVGADPKPVGVGSHRAHIYHLQGDRFPEFTCIIEIDVPEGNVVFDLRKADDIENDVCSDVTRVSSALEKYIPPAK
ncbi:DUF3558 family protein [Nocardia sp. CA-135953]|uniref:DUF3558 family protein n=1 Tax=Nocardia sp. CA-135953 TaxID=3239978 RepID=UPI003D974CCA